MGRKTHTGNGVEMDLRKIHSRVQRRKAVPLVDEPQKDRFFSNTAAKIPSPLIKAVYEVLI